MIIYLSNCTARRAPEFVSPKRGVRVEKNTIKRRVRPPATALLPTNALDRVAYASNGHDPVDVASHAYLFFFPCLLDLDTVAR
jgi:hypothetical protein